MRDDGIFNNIILARFAAVAGALFCYALYGAGLEDKAGCNMGSCAIYANFSIFGVSTWLYGVAAFTLLALFPSFWLALALLGADVCFLFLMFFGAPCQNCLFVAFAFALIFAMLFFFNQMWRGHCPKWMWIICAMWLLLFIGNMGALVSGRGEVSMGHGGSDMSIWFSPSCPACAKAIKTYPDAALYPVPESRKDIPVIEMMATLIEQGMSPHAALMRARREAGGEGSLLGEIRYWKNRAKVMENGGELPLLIQRGFRDGKEAYFDDFIKGMTGNKK